MDPPHRRAFVSSSCPSPSPCSFLRQLLQQGPDRGSHDVQTTSCPWESLYLLSGFQGFYHQLHRYVLWLLMRGRVVERASLSAAAVLLWRQVAIQLRLAMNKRSSYHPPRHRCPLWRSFHLQTLLCPERVEAVASRPLPESGLPPSVLAQLIAWVRALQHVVSLAPRGPYHPHLGPVDENRECSFAPHLLGRPWQVEELSCQLQDEASKR
mmetsp:Transcript_64903/g.120787  ORF Transcript_64903/g.120787 Transcript_64903/m.120787 type:complete len:210 (-) Transcript_64903:1794-2423(-)